MPEKVADDPSGRSRAARCALLAFSVHLIFIIASLVPGWSALPLESQDAPTYIAPARNLVAHRVFSREPGPPFLWEPYRTPVYPAILAGSIALTGDFKWALFAAAISAGIAAWSAVRLVARLGGSRRAQRLAGVLVAILPNSLGLTAMIMTDAIFGHLTLLWLYLLVTGTLDRSGWKLSASALVFAVLQGIKPTLDAGAVVVAAVVLLLGTSRRRWIPAALLTLLTLPVPLYLAGRNLRDHAAFAPTLLGVTTAREYLQARYISRQSGGDITEVTSRLRTEDRLRASRLSEPSSFYGRLYRVQKEEVGRFVREHPAAMVSLLAREMVRQLLAPQEFAFHIFIGMPPLWLRAAGSLFTALLWVALAVGGYVVGRSGRWPFPAVILVLLLFFLATGAISHGVSGRLRFPADMAAVPLMAIGLARLGGRRTAGPRPEGGTGRS